MAQWRKVVVSGSTAELNNISASGNIVPVTTDGSSLGTLTHNFSDLYLDSGAVVNFDSSDMTLTHAANEVQVDGGDLVIESTNKIGFGGSPSTDYIQKSTDIKIVAAADIILDPGGGEVDVDGNLIPNTDSTDDLGASGKAWNKLWVDDIDLNAQGSISIGGTGRIDLDADDDTSIRASADDVITFEAAGADQVAIADGTLTPSTSDDISLGTTALQFSDLFLAEGGVINWDNGDITLTQTADQLALAGGYLTVAGSITGSHFSGSASSTGSFGYLNVYGDAVIAGNLTFGDADTDTVSFGADIGSNLIPDVDDTYDLGSATKAWQDLFLEGDINFSDAGAVQTTAGNLQIDSLAATLVLDGHTGVDIDASNSGKVAIDGAGGIDIGVATDVAIDIDSAALDIDASGAITIDGTSTIQIGSNANAGNISIGDNATARTVTVGNDTGATSLVLNSGTGDIIATSTDAVTVDAVGVLELNSSVGAISIGNDDVDQNINIGTQGERTISVGTGAFADTVNIGNATGATAVSITSGTGHIALASTGAGDITINSDDTLLLDSDGVLELNSSAGAISIGDDDIDQAINIGTQGERTISIGTGAFADTVSIGNATGATALVLNSGTGDIVAISTDAVTVDAAGVLELNSSAGAIGVGNDAVGQKISVGGDIVTRTEVELNAILVDINGGASGVTIDGGGAISLDSGAASNFTTTAGDITIDAETASVNIDGGESATNAVRIVASHTAGGIDVDAGTNGINVDSTGTISIGGTNATTVTLGRVGQTITMPGNVDVNGTVFTIDATNIMISESFATFCSGSNIERDGGFMVESSSTSTGKGFGWDASIGRWGVDHDLAYDAFEIGAESSQGAYFALVLDGTTYSHTTGSEYAKPGNIWIDGDDDVWIYT